MKLPGADRATVEPAKIQDYLLSVSHPVGRFKAAFFLVLGYRPEEWEILRADLLTLAQSGFASTGQPSSFGMKYEVDGVLTGPAGRSAAVRSVWIVDAGKTSPRFVTAFPR